ncbi:MAG: trypsin-like peptidase domain-containing protein [Pseudomonadota bacterium]
MKSLYLAGLLAAASGAQAGPEKPLGLTEALPELKAGKELAVSGESHLGLFEADLARAKNGQAIKYGVPRSVDSVKLAQGQATAGTWAKIDGDRWVWRLAVNADGATSMDFGFSEFFLPHGASLFVYDEAGQVVRGPFTDQDHQKNGQLWTPVVPGPKAVLELVVPTELKRHVRLSLAQVNYGYRFFTENPFALNKSLSCNVDVACPEAAPFNDQVRSVAAMTVGTSVDLCSGALINNTAEDSTPYFFTADHCGITDNDAANINFYFNYESNECRSGAASGQPIPISSVDDVLSGSSLIATYTPSDFTLLRLDDQIPDSFNVFFAGWDRTGNDLQSAFSIHHPRVEEKRISIENDPVTNATTTNTAVGWAPDTHFQVNEWDSGITEGGSSGSPLFDQNRRIIGQLTGGAVFSCPGAEEGADYYGLIEVSWEGGGTPESRLRDWLDPVGSNATVLDGANACDAPSVNIVSTKGAVTRTGELVEYTAQASGGAGPYTYAWDVDGDGLTDSTSERAEVRYHNAFSGSVEVRVTDNTGCAGRRVFGVVVENAQVEVSSVGAGVEMCGNGDSAIDPGEAWSYPVTFRNSGGAAATGAFAALAVSGAGAPAAAKLAGGPDNFGYTFADSNEPTCAFDFQDISGSGTPVQFTPTNADFPALDDGAAVIDLGGTGFDYYGQALTELTMVTNGYLSTDAGDSGGDVTPDCPLPSVPSTGGGGRLYPLHDDLVLDSAYHQYFANCPRPGEATNSAGCNIFQWNITEIFNGGTDDFVVQAILYDDTNQIVYQYPAGNPQRGAGQTAGIQNAGFNDALVYACDTPESIADNSAVCIFHPASDAPGLSSELKLSSGAVDLGNLAAGGSTTVNVGVEFDTSIGCGDGFGINYAGTGHAGGFSRNAESSVISGQVADSCSVVSNCATPNAPNVEPRDGFWFNSQRGGNGIDLHFLDSGIYSAWYTADANRLPVWYYVQTLDGQRYVNDTVTASILRFTASGDVRQVAPTAATVGQAQISFIDPSRALMTWTINGESNGELLEFFDLAGSAVDQSLTDQFFNNDEAGWGFGTQRQGPQEFSAIYFYDTAGEPSWVVVVSDGTVLVNQGDADLASFKAHCPGCAWTPPVILPDGSMTRTFNADGSMLLNSLDVQVDGEVTIDWQRGNLPLQQIVP